MKCKNDYQRKYYQTHPKIRGYRKEYSKMYRKTKKYKNAMRVYRHALVMLKNKHEEEFDEILIGLKSQQLQWKD